MTLYYRCGIGMDSSLRFAPFRMTKTVASSHDDNCRNLQIDSHEFFR
jgi:hypothetical protein